MNWNVRLAYAQTIAQSIGFGIMSTAFSVFVTSTQGLDLSNFILGNLFTVSGLASTIFVFPSGWAADKFRRDLLIRASVFFGVMAQVILIYATLIVAPGPSTIDYLFLGRIFGGIGFGLSGPAAQALLADSIPSGKRSKTFANMHFLNLSAAAIGPFLAVALTLILGDTWSLEALQVLIFNAAFFMTFAYVVIFFASDKYALEGKNQLNNSNPSDIDETLVDIKSSYDMTIPVIIVISGIIIGFGAGATVAFFPVLFADPVIGYNLPPTFVYSVVGIGNIATGFAGLAVQRLAKKIGRVQIMFLTQLSAIICLLGIVGNLILYQNNIIGATISILLLVVFYISRNALMNASGPISRSLIMDIVPSSSRAKWNSMETLAWGTFWALSASLGGFIVDSLGFIYVFLFTATLYTIATFILLIIKNRAPSEINE
ncbi:MAG: MFS transporter [Candidatus Hodarchaeales archaeon]